jgi:SRSO17 transposase
MDLHKGVGPQERLRAYAADLASVLRHVDRVRPFEDYCVGLLSTEGRKSVEPLAATMAPERTAAQHQSLLHFVASALVRLGTPDPVREQVLPSITSGEPIQAWIIDDTGFPKKGSHSVGVAGNIAVNPAQGLGRRSDGLAARRGTVANCVQSGPRPPRHAVAPRRDASAVTVKTRALERPRGWQTITWRDGSNMPPTSRFARWRVRPAHDAAGANPPRWSGCRSNGQRALLNRIITGCPR